MVPVMEMVLTVDDPVVTAPVVAPVELKVTSKGPAELASDFKRM